MRLVSLFFLIAGFGFCFLPEHLPSLPYLLRMLARALSIGLLCTIFSIPAGLWPTTRNLFPSLALVLFSFGVLVNGTLTALVGYQFDRDLSAAIQSIRIRRGFLTMNYDGLTSISILPTPSGYTRRDPLPALPPDMFPLFVVTEDRRFLDRITSIDTLAVLRAGRANLYGRREGASGLADQLAGILFDVDARSGSVYNQLRAKSIKTLLGWRVHDTLSKRAVVQLFLETLPLGGRGGHNIQGVESSARIDYGRPFVSLNSCEQLEILARAPNPSLYDPYHSTLDAYRQHYSANLRVAVQTGLLSPQSATRCRKDFLSTVLPKQAALRNVSRPFLDAAVQELMQRKLYNPDRHQTYAVTFDADTQRNLEIARDNALRQIRSHRLVARHRGSRAVTIDAIVVGAKGEIAAEVGSPRIIGGASSFVKPCVASAALALGIVPSINSKIFGMPISLAKMLYTSDTPAAVQLGRILGLPALTSALRGCGYTIPQDRAAPFNAAGYGANADLRTIAGTWVYNFSDPGVAYAPHWLRDAPVPPERLFPTSVAVAVRDALTLTSRRGTTSKSLREFAADRHAVKTGTAAYLRRKTYLGSGGSVTIAALTDGRIVAIRVRYRDGQPFEVNGSDSAALVLYHLLKLERGD